MRKSIIGAITATLGLTTQAGAVDLELQMFEAAKERGTAQSFSVYLETFPNGRFVEEAQYEVAARNPLKHCAEGSKKEVQKTGQATWDFSCVPYT